MTGPARVKTLEELDNDFISCRISNHWWKHINDKIVRGSRSNPQQIVRSSKCVNCDTDKEEWIEIPSCEVVKRQYNYPDNYLLVGNSERGGTKVSRQDFRQEQFRRMGIVKRREMRLR